MTIHRCADPLHEPEQWLRHVLDGTRLIETRGRPMPELEKLAGLAAQAKAATDALLVGLTAEVAASSTTASPQKVLQDATRMSKRDANRMARTAKGLEKMPNVKERLAAGKISLDQAGVLVNTARETGAEAVDNSLQLLDRASEVPPDLFAGEARRFADRHSADRGEKLFNRQRRRRKAAMWKDPDTGMGRLSADLDPVDFGLVEQALHGHAEALRRQDLADASSSGAGTVRTREQRLADALTDRLAGLDALSHAPLDHTADSNHATACREAAGLAGLMNGTAEGNRAGDASGAARSGPGTARGKPPQLIIVADIGLIDGPDPHGRCEIPGTGPVPPSILDRLSPDTKLAGIIFGGKGQPLWLGRSRRDVSAHQYLAIAVRDRGCVKCAAPMHQCQIHHTIPWEHGGGTDIDNLQALCGQHHRHQHEPHQPHTSRTHNNKNRANSPPAKSPSAAQSTANQTAHPGRQARQTGLRRQKRPDASPNGTRNDPEDRQLPL